MENLVSQRKIGQILFVFGFFSVALVIASFVIANPQLALAMTVAIPALFACLVLILFVKRAFKWSWCELFLGVYVVLFTLSLAEIGRIILGGKEFPIYILLLPALILFFLVRQRHLFRLRIGSLLLGEIFLLGILMISVLMSAMGSSDRAVSFSFAIEMGVFVLGYVFFSSLVDNRRFWQQLIWLYIVFEAIVLANALYGGHFQVTSRLVPRSAIVYRVSPYAFMLEVVVLILFGLAITSRDRKKTIIYMLGLAFFTYGLALTFSRSAWISAVVAAVVFLFLSLPRLKWQRLLILFVGLVLALVLIFPSVWLRVQSIWNSSAYYDPTIGRTVTPSNSHRWSIFQQYLDEVSKSPFVGRGLGVYLETGFSGKSAHNSYLDIMASSGLPAFLILLMFLTVHGVNLWQVRRYLNQHELWGNVLIALYVAMLVQMSMQIFLSGNYFWVLLGFQGAAINIYSKNRTTGARTRLSASAAKKAFGV